MAKRSPRKNPHGQHRPRVDGGVEGESEASPVHPEEVLAKEQVPGARDGQELGEELHHAQKDGLEEFRHAG